MTMKAGMLVEVRSLEEILATLAEDGSLDRMPFMPEMLKFCGHQFQVSAVAHKTCDTAFKTGGRKLRDTVHLEDLRCDGSAHGGCQAACRLFWKTAWLKPAGAPPAATSGPARPSAAALQAATTRPNAESAETCYSCQATRLFEATEPLPWWDVRQFWRDVRCGNATIARASRVLTVAFFRSLTGLGIGYRAFQWLYNRVHTALNGFPAPSGTGVIPLGQPTPGGSCTLRHGDVVRVRSHEEIKQTLNTGNKNRGMWFDEEMVKFCGHEYRVAGRVDRIIDEISGKMLHMKQPCIVLDGVWCTAEYTNKRLLCTRAVTTYWRENWLEPVASEPRPRGAVRLEPVRDADPVGAGEAQRS